MMFGSRSKRRNHALLEICEYQRHPLSKLEKFQCSSDLPNIKYNCALLFWSKLYWVFIYDLKYIFS